MVRVGLIGAGFIGRNHFNQYEKMSNRATVAALCDKEADRRAGDWSKVGGNVADAQGTKRNLGDMRTYTDWHELIADAGIDMVDICAPTFLHREIAVAALEAGKHVLCEKPMALSVEDCDAMLATADRAKGKFMVAQCVRFWPEYLYLKRMFDERQLGELKALQLRRHAYTPDYALNRWNLDPKLAGGAILDLHVHDVDYVLHLLGTPRAIAAQGYRNPSGAVDRIHALWHYPSGPAVQIEGYWDIPPGFDFNMGFTAVFENGAVVWDMNTGKPLTVYRRGSDPETPTITGENGYFAEIEYFLNCIESDQDPVACAPADSRDAVAISLAEKDGCESGQLIKIT